MRSAGGCAATALRGWAVLLAVLAWLPAEGAAQAGTLRRGDVVLHYWPGQDRLATSLMPPPAGLVFPLLPPDVLDRGQDVNVFLAPDAPRWDSLTGGRAPDWGAGVAFPGRGTIVIPGYVSGRGGTHTLPQVLRHELAHIALQRALQDVAIPRWFNEGYAVWAAGQFDDDAGWMLRLAFVTNRAPPLDSITLDWPLLEADARLAYLLSATAVRYLHSLGTDDTFQRFLRELGEHGDFERALREVYIVSSPQFERLWRAHVRRSYGWLQFLAQSMFVWLTITALVLVLFVVRRRRNRRRMRELLATEPPDQPAYWMGEMPDAVPDQATGREDDGADSARDGVNGARDDSVNSARDDDPARPSG
ncbi:MAG TPA: hypothetical protein VK929_06995 [Longimicrobiales bacterium]|nr:hypothetical protein [Longimicrobiales bacterium]